MAVRIVFFMLSSIITLLLFLYGYNCYYLLAALRRYRDPAADKPGWSACGERPSIAVHLPLYNEKYVAERLIAACGRMIRKYGTECAKIVVIDDSTDDTIREVERVAEEQRSLGVRIEVIHRECREGFKAGALQYALQRSEEDLIAIFDADFAPTEDFLTVAAPCFVGDPGLAVVQGRWDHINKDFNFLTRAISIGIDVHFFIEQPARCAAGCFLNFNGSGGLIRREALLKAGGWQSDTLAEDLDVSYRMQLEGYRVLYLRGLRCPGEVPPTMPSFKKQQARWACGSLRAAKKLLPRLLADRSFAPKKRLEGFIHLTYYMVHPLMFISFLLAAAAALFGIDTLGSPLLPDSPVKNLSLLIVGTAILVCTFAFWLYPLVALKARGLRIFGNIPSLVVLGLIGFGVSLSNTLEAAKALLSNRVWAFERTPKYAVKRAGDNWKAKQYQVPLDVTGILEALMTGLGIISIAAAIARATYLPILIIAPYTLAFAFVSSLTFIQSRASKAS